jgi:hypothetical protein
MAYLRSFLRIYSCTSLHTSSCEYTLWSQCTNLDVKADSRVVLLCSELLNSGVPCWWLTRLTNVLLQKKKLYQKRLHRCVLLLVYHAFAGNVRTSTNWTEVSLPLRESSSRACTSSNSGFRRSSRFVKLVCRSSARPYIKIASVRNCCYFCRSDQNPSCALGLRVGEFWNIFNVCMYVFVYVELMSVQRYRKISCCYVLSVIQLKCMTSKLNKCW